MLENHTNINEEFKTLVEIVGDDTALKLMKTFGGMSVYIPQLKNFEREKRNEQIYNDFLSGMSIRKIALKYKVAEATIRKIARETK